MCLDEIMLQLYQKQQLNLLRQQLQQLLSTSTFMMIAVEQQSIIIWAE